MRNFKKFLAALSATVLATSSLAVTALADEVKLISSVTPGTYSVDAGLSCYTSAMGGIDFGKGMVTGTALNVDDSGNGTLNVSLAPSTLTIYGQSVTVSIDDSSAPMYYDGTNWQEADYTSYVDTVEFPISGSGTAEYDLGLHISRNQFGGPNADTTSKGEKLASTLTVIWPDGADTGLEAGSYDVTASLKCYTSAMGGIDFGAGMVESAAIVVTESGDATLKLDLTPVTLTIYGQSVTVFVDDSTTPVYYDGSAWQNAGYATVVDSVAIPVAEAGESYNLALHISRYQFGGPNASVTSKGEKLEAVLSVDWSNVTFGSTSNGDEIDSSSGATSNVQKPTLESGTYAVDLTWVPVMDNMLDPIVEIDAENNTFKIYNATAPETDKGSGSITFNAETGEYTLTYEAGVKEDNIGKTTVATYDAEKDTLTFKSALLYGSSSFNNTDNAGNFVEYTAVLTTTEVVYDASSNAVVTKDQMKDIVTKNAEKDVVIKSNNDITITFAKGTMKEVEGMENYDFATAIVSDYASAQVPSSVAKDDFVAKISYNYSGNLPAEASIKIFVGKDYAGKDLYYSLLKDGVLSETQKATVDADGYMTVKQSHCSDYVVTTTDPSANTTDNNTTDNNTTNTTEVSPKTGESFHFVFVAMFAVAGIILVMMGKKYGKEA